MRSVMISGLRMNALKIAAIGLLSIIFLVSFGLVIGSASMGAEHASMVDCPLMAGDGALCPMGIFEHLGTWQTLARSMPERFGIIMSLSMMIAFFVLLIAQEKERWRQHSIRLSPLQALHERNFPDNKLFVFVKTLFSQGILHPKIF